MNLSLRFRKIHEFFYGKTKLIPSTYGEFPLKKIKEKTEKFRQKKMQTATGHY